MLVSCRRAVLPALHKEVRCISSSRARLHYNAVNEHDLNVFKEILSDDNAVITDADQLDAYNTDWMKHYKGAAPVALLPKTTQQVSAILKHCSARRLAVVPQGGNTGLVGGSVPVSTEVVLSTSRMNSIVSFDAASGVLITEAGCILENLDNWLRERGFCMPLDLGAKGSCQIGGNVSSNAGGTRFVRYGSLRSTVLGLEAVLADGTILDLLTANRKVNSQHHVSYAYAKHSDRSQSSVLSCSSCVVLTECSLVPCRITQATT
jgi:D-2-hydroxyglutarate dehydrogenase